MMDDESAILVERFVVAAERIASALEGLHEQAQKAGRRFWPDRGKPREPVVTHIPTEEDKAREDQGLNDTRPVSQWLSGIGDDPEAPFIGSREREWVAKNANEPSGGPKAGGQAG